MSLLGPIAAVAGFAERRSSERTLGAGPRAGETFAVEVPTHAATVLRLAQGALATMTVSFEARGQYLSGLSVYGSEGSLVLPDANGFGGDVVLRHGRDEAEPVEYVSLGAQETRGLGIEELAAALVRGAAHRASGELALHVLEAAEAAVMSAGSRPARSRSRRVPAIGAPAPSPDETSSVGSACLTRCRRGANAIASRIQPYEVTRPAPRAQADEERDEHRAAGVERWDGRGYVVPPATRRSFSPEARAGTYHRNVRIRPPGDVPFRRDQAAIGRRSMRTAGRQDVRPATEERERDDHAREQAGKRRP